jgi:hypothetical protein
LGFFAFFVIATDDVTACVNTRRRPANPKTPLAQLSGFGPYRRGCSHLFGAGSLKAHATVVS